MRAPAWIRSAARANDRRLEQFVDVRSTNRAVVTAAEAYVLDRRPLHLDLVGVGIEPFRVARVSIAALRRQVISARHIVHDRQMEFGESLKYMEPAGDRLGRGTAAGQT